MPPSKLYLQNTHRHDIISSIVIYGGDTVELDNNNHSVFSMYYHLVLVIKYRRKVIDDKISDRLKEIFEYIAPNYNIALQEWNHDKDQRLIKKEHSTIRKSLWKEYFWSRSFCLLTTSGAPIEVVRRYIESQGEKI